MIFNTVALKMAWAKIKNPDAYQDFSMEQLGLTRFFNYLAIIINSSFAYYFLNTGYKYAFIFFIFFYSYRAFLLERYIKNNVI